MRSIISRKGIVTYLLVIMAVLSGFVIGSAFVNVYLNEQETMPLYMVIVGILGLLSFVWMISLALTLKVNISKQALYTTSIYGKRHLDWDVIEEVRVWPTFFNRNWVQLPRKDGRRIITILIPFFANHHELVKAIIEAAYLSNLNITLNMWAKEIYGKPPYGIFTDNKVKT